jgi:hypothetical protein
VGRFGIYSDGEGTVSNNLETVRLAPEPRERVSDVVVGYEHTVSVASADSYQNLNNQIVEDQTMILKWNRITATTTITSVELPDGRVIYGVVEEQDDGNVEWTVLDSERAEDTSSGTAATFSAATAAAERLVRELAQLGKPQKH